VHTVQPHEECRLLACDAPWACVGIDVSEGIIASNMMVKRISNVITTLAITSYCQRCSCLTDSFHHDDGGDTSSVTSIVTRATWSHVQKDDILHSHRRQNLKPYTVQLRVYGNCLIDNEMQGESVTT
jgi:hypothetical protein